MLICTISLSSALMALILPNLMLPCMNWQSIHGFSIHMLRIYPVMFMAVLTLPLSTAILWIVMCPVPKKLRWLQQ